MIFANAAPHVVADMLPKGVRDDFMSPYRERPLSITLMSATVGLNQPPAELGVTHYSTVLVPDWVRALSDYKKSVDVLAQGPGDRLPVLTVVDYNQIDSGLRSKGLYSVNVVCVDRVANWEGLDTEAYGARKRAWLSAILARLDQEWPGFAAAAVESTVTTGRAMQEYLNTPEGAIYGFALRPPRHGPIKTPQEVETSVKGLWLASAFAGGGGFTGSMGCGAAAARAALKANAVF